MGFGSDGVGRRRARAGRGWGGVGGGGDMRARSSYKSPPTKASPHPGKPPDQILVHTHRTPTPAHKTRTHATSTSTRAKQEASGRRVALPTPKQRLHLSSLLLAPPGGDGHHIAFLVLCMFMCKAGRLLSQLRLCCARPAGRPAAHPPAQPPRRLRNEGSECCKARTTFWDF
jgi:hypothetical protein